MTRLRRIALVLAASSGMIAATATRANAGIVFGNHCEPRFFAGRAD